MLIVNKMIKRWAEKTLLSRFITLTKTHVNIVRESNNQTKSKQHRQPVCSFICMYKHKILKYLRIVYNNSERTSVDARCDR